MKLRPVIAIWSDISGYNGWSTPEELDFKGVSICQRICYLLEENETHYKFMAGTTHQAYEDICAIPKHNVIAMYDIKLPSEVKGLIKKFEKGHIISEADLKTFEIDKNKKKDKKKIATEQKDKDKSKNESNKVVIEESKDKGNIQ